MELTTEWMKAQFAAMNREYFAGELPTPEMHVGHSHTQLGLQTTRIHHRAFRKPTMEFEIRLSDYYEMSERQLQTVLLHEMIHLLIASKRWRDTSVHGRIFRREMARLNALGWEIRISTPTSDLPIRGGAAKKQRLVLGMRFKDGRHYFSVVNRRYAVSLERQLKRLQDVEGYEWFESDDEYFARFSVVRSLRARLVTKEFYEEKIRELRATSSAR